MAGSTSSPDSHIGLLPDNTPQRLQAIRGERNITPCSWLDVSCLLQHICFVCEIVTRQKGRDSLMLCMLGSRALKVSCCSELRLERFPKPVVALDCSRWSRGSDNWKTEALSPRQLNTDILCFFGTLQEANSVEGELRNPLDFYKN